MWSRKWSRLFGESETERFEGVSSFEDWTLEWSVVFMRILRDLKYGDLDGGDIEGDKLNGELLINLEDGFGVFITVNLDNIFSWLFSYLVPALILAMRGLHNYYLILWLFFLGKFKELGLCEFALVLDIRFKSLIFITIYEV